MVNFKPFKGLHVKEENINKFPMYSPEIYTEAEIKSKLRGKKISYIDVIRATFARGEAPLSARFKKVRKRFEEYLEQQVLEQDAAAIYIYEQKKPNGDTFGGVIGLVSVDDFKNMNIKASEDIVEEKQKVFCQFLDIVRFQSNPVLLVHESNPKLEVMTELEKKSKPIIYLTDDFGIIHKMWKIENRLKLSQFKETIEKIPEVYLADGTYRVAGSVAHSETVRKKGKGKGKDFLWDYDHYVMALMTSHQSFKISEYNRLIKSIGMTEEEFLEKLAEHFTINFKGTTPYFPSQKHHISMYLDGEFYGLYIKHEYRGKPEGVGNLDAYLFEKYLLSLILQMKENDKRISFIKGTGNMDGILDLKKAVDNGEYKAGFGFYPAPLPDLQKVADLGLKMPRRTAYVEPKLLSGLIIFDMK
ncbi:MAG: DUF1015 domain-containing protein [Flavobacteriaceae bacterium]|jgi:uncharacterized protein (DUF1015 family)|nr:DUF1015 domain-containing protein [Flavobacteriaceae bacterium]